MAVDYRRDSKVERLHGSVRDREVVMHGIDNEESAQTLMEEQVDDIT